MSKFDFRMEPKLQYMYEVCSEIIETPAKAVN